MADIFTKSERSRIMSLIRATNTGPERTVRSILHQMGYRFRIHVAELPGKPDIVLPRLHKIIFVHGCFWHGHRRCRKGTTLPASHSKFWKTKIGGNAERDRRNVQALRRLGWAVLVLWECEIQIPAKMTSRLLRFMNR